MAGIERRRSDRRSKAGSRETEKTRKARDRRANRKYEVDAVSLVKTVGDRIFNVNPETRTSSRRSKTSERRIKSNAFTRSRSTRMGGEYPPVLVRGGLRDMATPSKRFRTPKRRYDVALNVPGAEVRLPSLPSVRFGWRLLSGLLLVMMVAAAYLMLSMPTFQVDLIEVEGLERLSMADLDLALGITGESIASLDATEIKTTLLNAFQGIKDVRVLIGLPASVQLLVSERQPVAAWVYNGETRWMDEDGIVFVPEEGQPELPLTVHAEILPVQPGAAPEEASSLEEQYERFDPILVSVIQSMADYLPGEAQMVYDDNHGLGWSDARGWQVYFGTSLEEIDQKLVVYQTVVEQLESKGIQPSMISVEYLHAPFYRMEH